MQCPASILKAALILCHPALLLPLAPGVQAGWFDGVDKQQMFPQTFKLATVRGDRTAELFGDLIARIEQHQRLALLPESNKKKGKHATQDASAPGANHGTMPAVLETAPSLKPAAVEKKVAQTRDGLGATSGDEFFA